MSSHDDDDAQVFGRGAAPPERTNDCMKKSCEHHSVLFHITIGVNFILALGNEELCHCRRVKPSRTRFRSQAPVLKTVHGDDCPICLKMQVPPFASDNDHDFISFLRDGGDPTDDDIRQAAKTLKDSVSGVEDIDHADKLIEAEDIATGDLHGPQDRGKIDGQLESADHLYFRQYPADIIIGQQWMYQDKNSSQSFVNSLPTTNTRPPRCIEEQYCTILERNPSLAAKGSNSKYQCTFCGLIFVGGPQKIRVHLTGQSENKTRLSKCQNVPEEVKRFFEGRRKDDKNAHSQHQASVSMATPRNWEESHCTIVQRNNNPVSKSSNTKYECRYCHTQFVGGPQKIRVHLSGKSEGSTQMAKCPFVPQDVIQELQVRRKTKTTGETVPSFPVPFTPLVGTSSESYHDAFPPMSLPPLPPISFATFFSQSSSSASSSSPSSAPATLSMAPLLMDELGSRK